MRPVTATAVSMRSSFATKVLPHTPSEVELVCSVVYDEYGETQGHRTGYVDFHSWINLIFILFETISKIGIIIIGFIIVDL